MQKPQGYDEATANTGEYRALPAGGYICNILQAKEQESRSGKQMLALCLEIAEGEYTGYFKEQFDKAKENRPEAKWPCIFYQLTEGKSTSYFKGLITSIEQSNPGYSWDWNPDSLKGKFVGALFGKEQYEYADNSGKTGWSTKCTNIRTADSIRQGDFTIPEDKPLVGGINSNSGFSEVDSDGDLPF